MLILVTRAAENSSHLIWRLPIVYDVISVPHHDIIINVVDLSSINITWNGTWSMRNEGSNHIWLYVTIAVRFSLERK